MSSVNTAPRSRHYHGGFKGKVTKNTVQPAPAWRTRNLPTESGSGSGDSGGKILISNLPIDVSDQEVVDLMRKTIGPVVIRDSLMVHNAKGAPLGMAIVAFTRSNDAWRARSKYNGKVVDGKRAIKLEVIINKDAETPSPPLPSVKEKERTKSLFDRLGPASSSRSSKANQQAPVSNGRSTHKRQPTLIERTAPKSSPSHPRPHLIQSPAPPPPTSLKQRKKKGPKRVKKSRADLDREMEEYTAARSNDFNGNGFDGLNGIES